MERTARVMKWLIDFLKGKWLKHPLHPIKVDLKTFKVETRNGRIWVGLPPKRS